MKNTIAGKNKLYICDYTVAIFAVFGVLFTHDFHETSANIESSWSTIQNLEVL